MAKYLQNCNNYFYLALFGRSINFTGVPLFTKLEPDIEGIKQP